jgi:mannose-6-phosphate isomerase
MLNLKCQVQNYAWGRTGTESLVGRIAASQGADVSEQKPYAEYWVGDHVNGTSSVLINKADLTQQILLEAEFLEQHDG